MAQRRQSLIGARLNESESRGMVPKKSPRPWRFLVTTLLLTYALFAPIVVFDLEVYESGASPLGPALLVLAGFMPSLLGVVFTFRERGRVGVADLWKRIRKNQFPIKWYLVIVALPLALRTVQILFYVSTDGVLSTDGLLREIENAQLTLPFLLIPLILFGPVSEELG